jgi:peptidyl-prolyl cis-trans isomerase SurA
MKKLFLFIFLSLAVTAGFGQSKTKAPVKKPITPVAAPVTPVIDPVLLSIAGEEISRMEFERVFRKNNYKDSATDEKAVREYLELYINYKLKVKEAEKEMMDTSATFVTELSGYRKQLAQPYLTDKEVSENLLREAYDRLKKDVHASHILIQVKQDALPKDTLLAYNRSLKIRDMIMKGADFSKVARDSSEDPSAKDNGGDLGYFTGMQMVYPFETAAFNLKDGQVSNPVRTRFGYHIIKKLDDRPAQGEIHVAHIMIKIPKDANDSAITSGKKLIDQAYADLKAGILWDSVVSKYSDDKASVKRGGELSWFGTGRMVPEFEKTAFGLSKDGDYSAPIKTGYGWHIIKRLEKRSVPSFDEKKGELKQAIARDSRNEMSKLSMVNKIKAQYKFTETLKNKTDFINSLDTNVVNGEWDLNKAEKFNAPIFSLTDSTKKATVYTQQDFAKYVSTHQSKRPGINPVVIGNQLYDSWVNESLIAFEEGRLDTKYADFRNLMKEYRDGILLFDLTDKKVWSKAVKDTLGLQGYYDKNKNSYMWGARVDATIYTMADLATATSFRKQMKKGKKSSTDIINELNKVNSSNVTMRSGKFSKGENGFVDKVSWVKGLSENLAEDGKIIIVSINEVLPAQPKLLDEAKGLITADYQNYLEKSWIDELRGKYPVKVNEEVLKTIWKK